MKVRRDSAVLDCQGRFQYASDSSSTFCVSDDRLNAADHESSGLSVGEENSLDGSGLDSWYMSEFINDLKKRRIGGSLTVTRLRARTMSLEVLRTVGFKSRIKPTSCVCLTDQLCL